MQDSSHLILIKLLVYTGMRNNVGRKREELAPGLRSVTEGNHVILYRGTASGAYIARVLHTKQDIENMALFDEE